MRAGGNDSGPSSQGPSSQTRNPSPPASSLGRRRLQNPRDSPILQGSPSLGGRRMLRGGMKPGSEKDAAKKHLEMRRAMIRGENPQQSMGLSGTPTLQGRELKDGARNNNVIDCTLNIGQIRTTLPKSNAKPLDQEDEEEEGAHISAMLRGGDQRFRRGLINKSDTKMDEAFRKSFHRMSGALTARSQKRKSQEELKSVKDTEGDDDKEEGGKSN
eukprot:CAMPEP_0170183434 /NCGR_PEP_ID=MMETSP0040_2-20121228/30699_1 /TAXON_ID=641309 /ORGANISM="Lotharella oceanica, Strain CCMP622" /LENGTH=214 /DNA_ID=CAMNT_0010429169 /DNA_START=74 /DNA_END=718 /DNA_ORIENTATION=+